MWQLHFSSNHDQWSKQSLSWLLSCHMCGSRGWYSQLPSHTVSQLGPYQPNLRRAEAPLPFLWPPMEDEAGWERGCGTERDQEAAPPWGPLTAEGLLMAHVLWQSLERPDFATKHLIKMEERRLASSGERKGSLSNWRPELQWSAGKGAVLCLYVYSTAAHQNVSFTRCGGLRTCKCSQWIPRHMGSSMGVTATWSCTPTWDQAGLTMSSTCGR